MNKMILKSSVVLLVISGIVRATEQSLMSPVRFSSPVCRTGLLSDKRLLLATPKTMARNLTDLGFLGNFDSENSELIKSLAGKRKRPVSVLAVINEYDEYLSRAAQQPDLEGNYTQKILFLRSALIITVWGNHRALKRLQHERKMLRFARCVTPTDFVSSRFMFLPIENNETQSGRLSVPANFYRGRE